MKEKTRVLVSPSRVNVIQFMYVDKHSRAPDMTVGRRDEEGGEACDMEANLEGGSFRTAGIPGDRGVEPAGAFEYRLSSLSYLTSAANRSKPTEVVPRQA